MSLNIKNILKLASAATVVMGMSAAAAQANVYNAALDGTATQSSLFGANYGPEKLIDGNISGFAVDNSINHTQSELNAWWQVDLGEVVTIDSIVIWNRTDPGTISRMNNFSVLVDGAVVATYNETKGPTPSVTFGSLNTEGQIIRVQLNDRDYFNLAEVQVFAVDEPASLAFIGAGLVFGLVARRRKQA